MLYTTPELDLEDHQALSDVEEMRRTLASILRTPEPWQGGLRRSMLARAIQGSNSIEGYQVEVDDAAAAMDDEESISADDLTFAEIRGYRQALGYVLAMAADPHFHLDAGAVRSMHFMMLSHELRPGQLAPGERRPTVGDVHHPGPPHSGADGGEPIRGDGGHLGPAG